MTAPPAGISEADWLATPASVRALVVTQQEQIQQLQQQLAALTARISQLEEQKNRNSRNSSKPPSSDGPGFQPAPRQKASGRNRGGQQGHPGSGPTLLPAERCDQVLEHRPEHCRRCGTHLQGTDAEPIRRQVIEVPPITPVVIEHRLHRLVCPGCGTSTCGELPAEVEPSGCGPRLSSLVGVLSTSYHLSIRKVQALLDQLLGVRISTGTIAAIRDRLDDVVSAPVAEAMAAVRIQAVVHVDETGAPTGNADGRNPEGRRGWLWVMATSGLTVFQQGLSRSAEAARSLLGEGFGGIVVSDRFSAYNHLPIEQRQVCWAHLRRDLLAMAERSGASGEIGAALMVLQRQLFGHWHQWKDGQIAWAQLHEACAPIRRHFEAELQRAAELGAVRGERTPLAATVRTCRQLLRLAPALWTFLEIPGVEPTNNSAERALRQAVIQRKISHGVQSAAGAQGRARLLTVVVSLRQQGRDVLNFLEQAWVAQRLGGVMPSLVPNG
jgi:transposase